MNKLLTNIRKKQIECQELKEICSNCNKVNGRHRQDGYCPPNGNYVDSYYLHWDDGPGTYFKSSGKYSNIN